MGGGRSVSSARFSLSVGDWSAFGNGSETNYGASTPAIELA